MGFLIWNKNDLKVFGGITLALVISVFLLTPPNLWGELFAYFLETPPLLILGQLGILITCSVLLFVVITPIRRLLK